MRMPPGEDGMAMLDPLSRLLDTRDWVLADGATGTALINAGLPAGKPPGSWALDNPDGLRAHHRATIAAGADLFLTNSFGANDARQRQWQDASGQDRAIAINRAAAEIACEVAAGADRPVLAAGSMGPTGEIMAPIGTMTLSRAVAIYTAQAQALRDGGVRLLWAETLSSLDEVRAIAEAARAVDLPWCVTMSFDTAGRSMMGVAPPQLAAMVEGLRNPPVAIGANCGSGPAELLRSLTALVASGTERPLIAKANAGVPHFGAGRVGYDGTPALMADYAVLARDIGARIIGGCCGTTAEHLRAMRAALEATPRGPRPSPEAIAARLTAAGPRI